VPLFSPRASRASCQKHLTTWASLNSLQITCATQLIGAGVDVRTVAGRLGHTDPSMTLRVYSHALEERDRAAAAVMGRVLVPPTAELPAAASP